MKFYCEEFEYDYDRYAFGYQVWGVPESTEDIASLYERGFLPYSIPDESEHRYYLCRSTRVNLSTFVYSSENRRVIRKAEGFLGEYSVVVTSGPEVVSDVSVVGFIVNYFERVHGVGVMTRDRLDYILLYSPYVVVYKYFSQRKLSGVVICHEYKNLVHFWFSAYDPKLPKEVSLGLFLMLNSAGRAQKAGTSYLYLGTSYGPGALYKTNFNQIEYFNGKEWVQDVKFLKKLLRNP